MRLPVLTCSLFATAPLALSPLGGAQSLIWGQQFAAPPAVRSTACAPDEAGGVFVAGVTSGAMAGANFGEQDVWIRRVDSSGDLLWIRQIGSSEDDWVTSAAPDGSGGLVLAGYTNGSLGGPMSGGSDAWIARFDASGQQMWLVQRLTPGLERVDALVVDGAGSVFVAGEGRAASEDAWIARYDLGGNEIWSILDGTGGTEIATCAAPDGTGGVIVGGYTSGSFAGPNQGSLDAWVARYDGAGTRQWITSIASDQADFVAGVMANGSGDLYVVGDTSGSLASAYQGNRDVWAARVDLDGQLIWIEQFGSPRQERVRAGVAAPQGGFYMGGDTTGSAFGPVSGGFDAWMIHMDRDGKRLWDRKYRTAGLDLLGALTVTTDGHGIAAGTTARSLFAAGSGDQEGWTAKFRRSPGQTYCSPAAVNSSGAPGEAFVAGSPFTAINNLELHALRLPQGEVGYFLGSLTPDFVPNAGGGNGTLCVGGRVSRFGGAGALQSTGMDGSFLQAIDLANLPSPVGPLAAVAGQEWHFQAWFRDGGASQFTDGVRVLLD